MNKQTFKTFFSLARIMYRNNFETANKCMKAAGFNRLYLANSSRMGATNMMPIASRLEIFKDSKEDYKKYVRIYLQTCFYG